MKKDTSQSGRVNKKDTGQNMGGLIKKTQASRSATRLDFHVVGHVGEHEVVGGASVAGEDEAFGEGGIETVVLGRGEPDEVSGSVVEGDAVEMVTLEVRVVMGTMPSGGDEEVNEVGVLGCSNDFVGLFASIVDTARRGFEEALREFSVDSDEGKNEIDVFAVFGRIKRFGRVTVLGGCTVG